MPTQRLFHRSDGRPAELLIRCARVLDPRAGLDDQLDILIRDGTIAEIGPAGSLPAPDGGETIEATGKSVFPAFVDPHVHLRTPGQEHKENMDTGTAAAAAGGFCAVIAMPNTDPVVDDVSVLRVVVRNGFGRDLAKMLLDDLGKVMQSLATSALWKPRPTKEKEGFHH